MRKILISMICLFPLNAFATEAQLSGYVTAGMDKTFELQSVVNGQVYVLDHGLTVQDCARAMIADIDNDTLRCMAQEGPL